MSQPPIPKGADKIHHQVVSLQLTWNCPAACRHCMVSGRPERSRVMSLAEAKRIIDQVQHLPLTRFFGFTGGEPFLSYDLILELARYIQDKYGYSFAVATNCYWAGDPDKAREMLQPLAGLGLAELLVSLDDFHLEFVDPKNIENCVRAAVSMGVHVTIQTIETMTGHGMKHFQEHLDLPGEGDLVRWVGSECHPAGRAASQVPGSDLLLQWSNSPGRCTAMRVWNIDPYGFVTPCCGTAFAPRLKMGNAFEEDLHVLVDRANVNPLVNTLAAWGGPYLLIKLLEANGYPDYSTKLFASHCHACDTVLRDERALELIDRELPSHWLEALASRLIAHELWFRSAVLQEEGCDWLPAGWLETLVANPETQEAPSDAVPSG